MTDLLFYDAAVPPKNPPPTDGVAFYIGGDAYNTWTKAQIDAQPARYRLPIFVRSNPQGANPAADVAQAVVALHNIGAPRGCLIAWDTETAADPAYMRTVYHLLAVNGYKLIDYGSQDNLFANELPVGGYYWGADWTGSSHLVKGDAGTQYANDGEYDLDVFKPGLPFWDTNPIPTWQEDIMQQLPVIHSDATGTNVETVQGLCCARGRTVTIDGIYGPITKGAVMAIQRAADIPANGVVDSKTWPALLGIA